MLIGYSVDRGDRPKAKNIIVLLTDGLTSINSHETARQLMKTHSSGTYILPIGVGMPETAELAALASDKSSVFVSDSFRRVTGIVPNVVKYLLEGEWSCSKMSGPALRCEALLECEWTCSKASDPALR